jgi:hypothetical protein
VAPLDVGIVAGGKLLVELDVGHEGRPGVARLYQVVAEDGVVGEPARDGLFERVDVVDALPDVGALLENVLVDVRDPLRVGVDPDVAGKEAREPGTARPGQADPDPRLQDAVAVDDDPLLRVEAGPVEGMGHRRDEEAGGVHRQLRVRVEGDDELDASQDGRVPHDIDEGALGASPKERVEFRDLPALSLVAHPPALRLVPAPGPVEQVEEPALRRPVLGVEPGYPHLKPLAQRRVARERLGVRVREIRQQREMKVVVAVREVMDLDRLEQVVNGVGIRDEGGHRHERGGVGLDALGVVQTGKLPRTRHHAREPVHHRDGQLAEAHEEYRSEAGQHPAGDPEAQALEDDGRGPNDGDRDDAPEIEGQGVAQHHPLRRLAQRQASFRPSSSWGRPPETR